MPSDAVPAFADGFDHRWVTELAPQPADSDGHGLSERVGGLVPDPLEQLLGGDGLSLCGEQALQYRQFFVGELKTPSGAERDSQDRVEAQVAAGEFGRRGRRASSYCSDTGDQLGEIKGLAR